MINHCKKIIYESEENFLNRLNSLADTTYEILSNIDIELNGFKPCSDFLNDSLLNYKKYKHETRRQQIYDLAWEERDY